MSSTTVYTGTVYTYVLNRMISYTVCLYVIGVGKKATVQGSYDGKMLLRLSLVDY